MPDNRPLLPKEPSFAALHEVKDIRIHQILIRPDLWKIGISCPFVPELQWIFVPASNALQTNVLEQAFRLQISVALTGNHLSRQGTWPRDQTPSSLCLTVESCVFMMTNQHVEEIILRIPFCGGVSGWQHAVRFLQDQGFPIRTPLACDIAEEAVESFSLTHGFHPAGQIGCQEILTRPTACVADASQGLFWMAASSLGCNTATASWPCQSFSVAGGRQGWAAPGGQSFRDMLDFCRLSGIRFLLLENVPEVWNDLNLRATLIAAIHEAGFRFLFAEILKLEHVVPAQRSRFIGVAEKGGENSKWTIEQAMKVKQAFQGPDRCLQVEGMWFASLPDGIATQCFLTDKEIGIYSCVRRSPKWVTNQQDALARRLVNADSRIPATTLMRSYTQQHLFRGVARGTDKLLGDLRTQQSRVRFFAPVEILLALGVTNPVNLPLSIVAGCQQVGNSIAQAHALAGIWVAIFCCDLNATGSKPDFPQIINLFRANRLGADTFLQIQADRCAIGFLDGVFNHPAPPLHEVQLVFRWESGATRHLQCAMHDTFEHVLQLLDLRPDSLRFSFGSQILHADNKIIRGGIISVEHTPTPQVSPTATWTPGSPVSTSSSNLPGPSDALWEQEPSVDSPQKSGEEDDLDLPYAKCKCGPQMLAVQVQSGTLPPVEIQVRADITGQQFNDAWTLLRGVQLSIPPHAQLGQFVDGEGIAILHEQADQARDAIRFFIRDPAGTARFCSCQRYESLGLVVQRAWPAYNPVVNKIHDGINLLNPQDTVGDQNIRPLTEVRISVRFPGGARAAQASDGDSLQHRIFNLLRNPSRSNGEVSETVKDFCSKLQDPQRDSLGQAADVEELRREIRKVAKALGFPISRLFHSKADRNATRKAPPVRLDISDVSFIPGTFFFEDKTEAKVQGPFDISQRGLYTDPPAGLEEILASGRPLAAFELGLLSFAPPPAISKFPATNTRCPAKDAAGHTLIIQGWILQLGGKHVKMSQATNHDVPCQPSGVVCVTTYRSDWDAPVPDWNTLIAAPAKTIIELLGTSSQDILEVWGRIWNGTQRGGRSTPAAAESFRIHLRVAEASLVALLGKSGTTNPAVFIDAFKDKESGLFPGAIPPFRIVWLPKEVGVTKAVAFHHKHIGLVRGRQNLGIRVAETAFPEVWAAINPGKPCPDKLQIAYKWRLLGAPSQAGADEINLFLKKIQVEGKVLRKAGQAWVFGTAAVLSEFTWAFNGQTVVAEQIPDNKKLLDPVVACVQKPALRPRIELNAANPAQKVDVLQIADPWAKALPAKALPSGVDFAGLNKAHDAQIQQHQKQITDLQQSMASLHGNVATLQKQSQKQEERTTQLHSAIQDTRASFEITLQKALEAQTSGLMAKLGTLIGPSAPQPQGPDPKRAKPSRGNTMDKDVL